MMTNEYISRLTKVAGLGVVVCAAAALGCSPSGKEQTAESESSQSTSPTVQVQVQPISTVPAATPVSPASSSSSAPSLQSAIRDEKIAAIDGFLEWYYMYEHYTQQDKMTPDAKADFEAKEQELRTKTPPVAVGDHFEVLAVDWKLGETDAKSETGKMLAKFVIRKNKDLAVEPSQKVQLFMRLVVDESHRKHFKDKDRDKIDFLLPVDLDDAAWPVGATKLVKRDVTLPVLPYNVFIFANVLTKEGEFVERLGGARGLADLGWHASLPEEKG